MVESPERVTKILFITLSSFGDAMMALPAFDYLRRTFAEARITVVASPATRGLFQNHPAVDGLIVFDKFGSWRDKADLFWRLRREGFDVVVDLKDTLYRWGARTRHKNPARTRYPAGVTHFVHRHLYKAIIAARGVKDVDADAVRHQDCRRNPAFITPPDREYLDILLQRQGVGRQDEFVLVLPGSRSDLKKWTLEGYAEVINEVRRLYGYRVVVAGDKADAPFIREVMERVHSGVTALVDQTNFAQLGALMMRAKAVVCNDSGVLHMASYLGRPVAAIFGPTDPDKYGPWSPQGLAVRKNVLCAPCGKASCSRRRQCLTTVRPYDVLLAVRLLLEGDVGRVNEQAFRRILVCRTDRLGDVILSTPALKAIRDHYPNSFLAVLVSAYTRQIVEGNPYVDQVITLDKEKRDRGFWASWRLARQIRSFKFDVAVVLHPTVRVHLLCYLAGIKERIGYDRKAPYFLSQRIKHTKQEGLKHETEYVFDLLRPLGISAPEERELTVPISDRSELFVLHQLREAGLSPHDRLVAVNPASSCLSRRWPLERFAEVIDRLMAEFPVKVVIVADGHHRSIAAELLALTHERPLDLSGRLDLSQLASLFRRCELVISNDSGPVHLAVAVKTPVIAIFGRNQPGLSPARWAPLGSRDVVFHEKTDCAPCLAHECVNHFKCLTAITVDQVTESAVLLLGKKSKPHGLEARRLQDPTRGGVR